MSQLQQFLSRCSCHISSEWTQTTRKSANMAEKYDVGTPMGGDRKYRRTRSPLHEMDDAIGQLDFSEDSAEEFPAPTTPSGAEPVTLAAIATLLSTTLDAKLGPVSQTMARLEEDVEDLKKNMTDVESIVQSNVDNIAGRVDHMEAELKHMKDGMAQSNNQSLINRLDAMEMRLSLQTYPDTPRSQVSGEYTAVVGGFKGAYDKTQLDAWMSTVFWTAGAKEPTETYIKGTMENFNGIAFAKYPTKDERDSAISKIQAATLDFDGQKVWAKPEQPLKTRTATSLLFAAKRMLVDWQFDKRSLWVDTENLCLTCGEEEDMIFKIELEERDLTIVYGFEWQTYMESDNETWTQAVEAARTNIKKQQLRKGVGKGKAKGKGKQNDRANLSE